MSGVHGAYGAGAVVDDLVYRGVTARLTLYGLPGAEPRRGARDVVCGWTCACGAHGFTSQAFTTERLLRDARLLWRKHVRRGCASTPGSVVDDGGDP